MTVYEIFPQIVDIPFFSIASQKNAELYLKDDKITVMSFSQGETIYSSASSDHCVGILIDGSAKVRPCGCDDKTLLKAMKIGDIFGIANLYAENSSFPSIITADKKARVMFIDGDAFKNFIENDPIALKCYLGFLSQKIVYLNKKISTFAAGSAESKLALYLIENSSEGKFISSLSMSGLANALGVGRASLYRALDKLINLNIIKKDGTDIYIIDNGGLLALTSYDHSTQF